MYVIINSFSPLISKKKQGYTWKEALVCLWCVQDIM
jgi:hypothetical protein